VEADEVDFRVCSVGALYRGAVVVRNRGAVTAVVEPRLPARDDLAHMPLLAATLQEALRLYPPAPVVVSAPPTPSAKDCSGATGSAQIATPTLILAAGGVGGAGGA
jgi:hypothetical protein